MQVVTVQHQSPQPPINRNVFVYPKVHYVFGILFAITGMIQVTMETYVQFFPDGKLQTFVGFIYGGIYMVVGLLIYCSVRNGNSNTGLLGVGLVFEIIACFAVIPTFVMVLFEIIDRTVDDSFKDKYTCMIIRGGVMMFICFVGVILFIVHSCFTYHELCVSCCCPRIVQQTSPTPAVQYVPVHQQQIAPTYQAPHGYPPQQQQTGYPPQQQQMTYPPQQTGYPPQQGYPQQHQNPTAYPPQQQFNQQPPYAPQAPYASQPPYNEQYSSGSSFPSAPPPYEAIAGEASPLPEKSGN